MAETHLSRAAYERLKAEYDDLTTHWRTDIAQKIERAREMGDLSENADYHAAKEEQGLKEARIRQLQAMLESAVIVESGGGDSGAIATGAVVTIRYEGDDEVERFLVGSIEERQDLPVISPNSPLGQALLGRRAGETVEYEAPSGTLKVDIVEVGSA
jgi:transcription elongation factor GreA